MVHVRTCRLLATLLISFCLSGYAQTPPTTAQTHTKVQRAKTSPSTVAKIHSDSKQTTHPIEASYKHTGQKPVNKPKIPSVPQNLWQQIAIDFKLPHQENRPEVQAQIHWFVSHPKYLLRVASHASYYMYYIHEQVVKRHLPGELVLLPMIESAYDPYAYSWVGAAGIWQMMPQTGLGFGLKQDWWYDARKSIAPSTKAALDYLFYLHNFFNGDWLLATAAYNYGEGNVQAAINRNVSAGKASNFWSLQLPLETESYVPRLLALSAIVANPSKYGVTLPYIPNRPYFGIVELHQQLEMSRIAQMADISSTELYELNPGFTRFATEPDSRYQLLLPISKIPLFEANLSGDQMDYRHPTEQLVAMNTPPTATPPTPVTANNTPQLPTSFHASPTMATAPVNEHTNKAHQTTTPKTYIVQPHQTLYAIAKSHGLTVKELEAMNHIGNPNIKAGDVLVVG